MAWRQLSNNPSSGRTINSTLLSNIKDNFQESGANTVTGAGQLLYGSSTAASGSSSNKLRTLSVDTGAANRMIQLTSGGRFEWNSPFTGDNGLLISMPTVLNTVNNYDYVDKNSGLNVLEAYAMAPIAYAGVAVTGYTRSPVAVVLGGTNFPALGILHRYYNPYTETYSLIRSTGGANFSINVSNKTWIVESGSTYRIIVIKSTRHLDWVVEQYEVRNGESICDVEPIAGFAQNVMLEHPLIASDALLDQADVAAQDRLLVPINSIRYYDSSATNTYFGGFNAFVVDDNVSSRSIPSVPQSFTATKNGTLDVTLSWSIPGWSSALVQGFEIEYVFPYVAGDGAVSQLITVSNSSTRRQQLTGMTTSISMDLVADCNLPYLFKVRMRSIGTSENSAWTTYRYVDLV